MSERGRTYCRECGSNLMPDDRTARDVRTEDNPYGHGQTVCSTPDGVHVPVYTYLDCAYRFRRADREDDVTLPRVSLFVVRTPEDYDVQGGHDTLAEADEWYLTHPEQVPTGGALVAVMVDGTEHEWRGVPFGFGSGVVLPTDSYDPAYVSTCTDLVLTAAPRYVVTRGGVSIEGASRVWDDDEGEAWRDEWVAYPRDPADIDLSDLKGWDVCEYHGMIASWIVSGDGWDGYECPRCLAGVSPVRTGDEVPTFYGIDGETISMAEVVGAIQLARADTPADLLGGE